jgi:hypothetical protein
MFPPRKICLSESIPPTMADCKKNILYLLQYHKINLYIFCENHSKKIKNEKNSQKSFQPNQKTQKSPNPMKAKDCGLFVLFHYNLNGSAFFDGID